LKWNLLKNYDDELRIFLVNCLKKIDYLSDLGEKSDEILTHLAMHMNAQDANKNQVLHKAKDSTKGEPVIEMIIIYNGRIALTTTLDSGTEIGIDYIGKGTVLNAHSFLSSRHHSVNVNCLTSVMYYQLHYEKLK